MNRIIHFDDLVFKIEVRILLIFGMFRIDQKI